MIDVSLINIRRVAMHQVIAKTKVASFATVNHSNTLLTISEEVQKTIKQRLNDATGKCSRAFELEIGDEGPDSFYSLCKDIKSQSNEEFLITSQNIEDLLGESQKRTSIPGGYIIVIDCTDTTSNLGRYIVIKAELHQALKKEGDEVSVLEEVFLSPSQRLYKIGIMFEKDSNETLTANNRFGCFLFDEQFRMDEGEPATYFYKSFLGFTVGKNAKIQSQKFYNKTGDFIKENFSEFQVQEELLSALRNLYTINTTSTISPSHFASTYFTDDIADKYDREVSRDLPASFVKDATLIATQIARKKITFPQKINLTGPNADFQNSVSVINSQEEFESLRNDDPNYTIIKIKGKPYQNECN